MSHQQPSNAEPNGSLPREHAALAALADGSLEPERAAVLEARAASSPELAAALSDQRRGVELIRAAAAEIEAPLALRERIERDRTRAVRL